LTCTPLRSTLSYGPASTMMLSPDAITCAGTGFRLGRLRIQPVVSAVAGIESWAGRRSLFSAMVFISHLPATSASEIGAGGGGGAGATAAVVSAAGGLAGLGHPAPPGIGAHK